MRLSVRGIATFLGGDYEDFIEARKKRDGRLGLGPPLANRDSHTYISIVVPDAWLHIIGILVRNDVGKLIDLAFARRKTHECFRAS